MALEHAFQEISKKLEVELLGTLECVKKLPKAQDMEDLHARVDCLFKENGELKSQVVAREAQLKEVGALKMAVEEKLMRTREDRNKALAIFRKFYDFKMHLGDVVNKAQLYNASMDQPGASLGPKVIRCLVDYNIKMEKLLKELRALFQPNGQQQAPEPSQLPIPALVTIPSIQLQASTAPTGTADSML